MQSKVPARYLIIPLLYLAIIAGLLYGYFGGAKRIRSTVGPFSVTAVTSRGASQATPSRITVGYGSLEFPFTIDGVTRTDSAAETLRLVGYSSDDTRITLEFENSVEIRFARADSTHASITIEPGSVRPGTIVLPLSSALDRPDHRVPVFTAEDVTLLLPYGGSMDGSRQALIVPVGEHESTVEMRLRDEESPPPDPLAAWLDARYTFSDPESVRTTREAFLDAVYTGWVTTRYSGQNAGWVLADGSIGFDESAFSLMVSSALARGRYPALYRRILEISRIKADSLTFRSSPILGNVVATGPTIERIDQSRIERIRGYLERGSPELFSEYDLFPFVLDRAPFALARELIDRAVQAEPPGITSRQAVGVVFLLDRVSAVAPELLPTPDVVGRRMDELIMPLVQITDRGLYLGVEPGKADLEAGVVAGDLLTRLGEPGSLSARIGSELLGSSLVHADDRGFLPASLDITTTGAESETKGAEADGEGAEPETAGAESETAGRVSEELVAPEPLYRLLATNPYIPREVSLFDDAGPGVWLWTAGGNPKVVVTDVSYTISFDFPVGAAHHFILRGIESVAGIELFGIPWKRDPRFQNYTSGWTYDPATQTLYVKITHRKTREEIVIRR